MTIIIFFQLISRILQIKCSRFSEICIPSSYSPDKFPNSVRRSASPFPLDDNFLARSMIFGCTVCQMLTRSVERATASLKSALIYHTLQANIVIQYLLMTCETVLTNLSQFISVTKSFIQQVLKSSTIFLLQAHKIMHTLFANYSTNKLYLIKTSG